MFENAIDNIAIKFTIDDEQPHDFMMREALLDHAMGKGRKRKSSEKLRRGRVPANGLALVVRDEKADLLATVRLWHVGFIGKDGTQKDALLLGPLAVSPELKGRGVGSKLMEVAIQRAASYGHGAILLVGDVAYYKRFGFSSGLTQNLAMPGPYEIERFQALELLENYLDGAHGVLKATGVKAASHIVAHRHVA